MNGGSNPDRGGERLAIALFVAALLFHGWGARAGWENLNLPGCEFRQAQTAISSLFIQRENNFSLAYPTPVLGKPWSIPMEFPLYQWTVVGLGNASGLPLTQAGRTVSLVCFYLTLPALYLLLAQLGLSPARRLVALVPVLCCPLYIFYARAFLIETMALMFGAWFLLGYVRTLERRQWRWWLVASVGGVGAGLVKVTTLLLFLMPALMGTFWWLWRDLCEMTGAHAWRRPATRALWAALAVALPLILSVWWVEYADAVKARSGAGSFLQSSALSVYNWGTGVRWSGELWRQHWAILFRDIASVPVLVVGGIIALVFARRSWALIGILVFCFFAVQVVFPVLYAFHDYYYVANAFLLMLALGLALGGLIESRLPRWIVWPVLVGVAWVQGWTYYSHHYPGQKAPSLGGNSEAWALAAITEPDDEVIIAGDDWSSITPYFAGRRALMIRRGIESDLAKLEPAFRDQEGEPVMALVLYGEQQQNRVLLAETHRRFRIDSRPVAFTEHASIHVHEQLYGDLKTLLALRNVPGVRIAPGVESAVSWLAGGEISMSTVLARQQGRFASFSPRPWKFQAAFSVEPVMREEGQFLTAYAGSHYWFKVPSGDHIMSIETMLLPDAYADFVAWGDRSDGVEVMVVAREANGNERRIFSRYLNPRDNPADRGLQRIELPFSLEAASDVGLMIWPGPQGNGARDWNLLREVRIK